MRVATFLLAVTLSVLFQLPASAQSTANVTSSTSPSGSTTVSLTTSTVVSTSLSRSGTQTVAVTTAIPTIFNVTVVATPTTSANVTRTASASASASTTAKPITLDTKIDPAFGVLGALLILTGIPSAFLGHKNRWTSFFLIGFYTLALVCWVLIVRFGVINAIKPPNKTIRGMFVLASAVAGVVGGGVAIFFWKASKYFIGGWGGLAFAWYIQCFRDGGLIDPIGFRWIMYIACGAVGFTLSTIPKIHYHIVLVSTGFVGATAFMLGVDCFTTANLKEFYMWNLGFKALFPKYTSHGIRFPVTQAMEIELGLMGAVALMGIAVQFQVLKILQRKLKEIAEDQKRRDAEEEAKAAQRFRSLERERDEWEKEHPGLAKHDRQHSALSGIPLLKDQEHPESPATPATEYAGSSWDLPTRRRLPSGLSDYNGRRSQSPGAIPALDLGEDIEENVPTDFLAPDRQVESSTMPSTSNTSEEELKKKEQLLAEIQSIRKSIEVLKDSSESLPSRSRRPSMASKRTLSTDLYSTLVPEPTHLRPPRARDPRARAQSMEMSDLVRQYQLGETISRPTSVPLKDDWDSYVNDRKLLQPPSGVTAPIPTTPVPDHRIPVPPAVTDALKERRKRESAMELGQIRQPSPLVATDSSPLLGMPARVLSASPRMDVNDTPHVDVVNGHTRQKSGSAMAPVTILPPQKIAAPQAQRPAQPRTKTFEELAERHREKIHGLQAPLSQAEKEKAELEAAKARWERSKALEREAVARRQAEKEKAVVRKSQEGLEHRGRRSTTMDDRGNVGGHSRSLSADKLAALGNMASSKRASTMKVEDWQRYQQEAGTASKRTDDPRRLSTAPRSPGTSVPFPDSKSRRLSNMPRDPPA